MSPDAEYRASIAIKNGLIHAIGAPEAMPPAKEALDARGLHILPGAIDVHVHFRDPGYPQKEDFASGTAAAAFGGVTTVFDMPNTLPTIGTPEALAAKHKIAAEKAYVDYGLYAVLGEDSIEHVSRLIDGGIIGFKLYMGNTFGRIPSPTTGAMLEAFEVVAPTGKRISLHAETNSIMERRESRLRAAGRTEPIAHLAARPAVVAVEAVARAAILAEWTGARIHVLHISSAAELRPLAEAKARGVEITGETCPHYLLLSEADYEKFGGIVRVNPPVREAPNRQPLWDALMDGTIDMIATDHAPHTPEEKTRNDIWTVDCGFPGVETQMPLMLTEINRGRATHSGLRAMECGGSGEDLGSLSPQGGTHGRLGRRHCHRRSQPQMDDRRRADPVALQNLAVAWAASHGAADSHHRARPVRDEGPDLAGECARHRPLGSCDPADAASHSAQHRRHDDRHHLDCGKLVR